MENSVSVKTVAQATIPFSEGLTRDLLIVGMHNFIHIANQYMQRTEGKPWELPEEDKPMVADLFLYLVRHPESRLDITKGLWFEGAVGTGKSTMMNICREFAIFLHRGFNIFSASELTSDFCMRGHEAIEHLLKPVRVRGKLAASCIDELGREMVPAPYYGGKLNVMQHVLQKRYTLWQSEGVLTHVTTNLDADNIEKMYDTFVFDRCRQMFNVISFSGKSKR